MIVSGVSIAPDSWMISRIVVRSFEAMHTGHRLVCVVREEEHRSKLDLLSRLVCVIGQEHEGLWSSHASGASGLESTSLTPSISAFEGRGASESWHDPNRKMSRHLPSEL